MEDARVFYKTQGSSRSLIPEIVLDKYDYKYPAILDQKRPSVILRQCAEPKVAYRSLLSNFKSTVLDQADVCAYLAGMMEMFQGVCPEDWISYNILIAKKGDIISPRNLVNIELDERAGSWQIPDGSAKIKEPTESEHATLIGLLLCLYRLSKINQSTTGNYKTSVATRMEHVFQTEPFTKIIEDHELVSLSAHCSNWSSISNFRFLVGTYDMFFSRIEHKYSALRVGTVVTAYEDCVGLVSFSTFIKQVNLTPKEALQYFFHRNFLPEFERMFHPGQETSVPHSYFVHFRALGLSGKSPYSSNAVGHIFNLIHFIGCYMGQSRSLNATMITNCSPHEMAVLGGFLGEAFYGSGSFERQFFESEEEMAAMEESRIRKINAQLDDSGTVDSDTDDESSQGMRSPDSVFQRIKDCNCTLTVNHVKRYKTVSQNHAVRPNSFGEYLQKTF
ncbi:TPA: Nucleoprotein [Anole lyssa-like virus 1]|uniref:Nucleoprotein n=1 Tax=Anole lyssa-like virus 1 TaxID=2772344 RepID=A0AAD3AVD9_9RHAB|nr:Nucleoprotein [Anole lyssa-like virus 1]FAA01388.1 TPA: Nucleoprotein [Anole lyssa-like virus 1]